MVGVERLLDVLEEQDEVELVGRAWLELGDEVEVEAACPFRRLKQAAEAHGFTLTVQ
jgi:hypothetical protein